MEKKVFVLFCFSWLCLLCPILAAERTDTLRLAAHRGGITQGAFDEYDPASIDSAISKRVLDARNRCADDERLSGDSYAR